MDLGILYLTLRVQAREAEPVPEETTHTPHSLQESECRPSQLMALPTLTGVPTCPTTAPSPTGPCGHRHPKKKESIWLLEARGQLSHLLVNKTAERFFGSRVSRGRVGTGRKRGSNTRAVGPATLSSWGVPASGVLSTAWWPQRKDLVSWSLVFSHEEVILRSSTWTR